MKGPLIFTISLILSISAQANSTVQSGQKVKLIDAGSAEKVEIACMISPVVLTEAELDSRSKHTCYTIKFKNAKVQNESGNIVELDELKMGMLHKKITGSLVRQSESCTDRFIEKLNTVFSANRSRQEQGEPVIDLSKTLRIGDERLIFPNEFEVNQSFENSALVSSTNPETSFSHENSLVNGALNGINKLINTTTNVANVRKTMSLENTQTNISSCMTTSKPPRNVIVDDEKYNSTLDGSVVDDSRNYFANIWGRAASGTTRILNNTAAAISR